MVSADVSLISLTTIITYANCCFRSSKHSNSKLLCQ